MVEKVSPEESDLYFSLRPPKARLGALVSNQSRIVSSREELVRKFEQLSETYLDQEGQEKIKIERPPHWGGYRLTPQTIEFWKGRTSRIHDRIRYTRDVTNVSSSLWTRVRLQP
jgi:pyridoxamine 5'-phosphate oxidase